jgi:hypothetical protein
MIFLESLSDVQGFMEPVVQRTKVACRPTEAEARVMLADRESKRALPLSVDMMWVIRDQFWSNQSWLCEGMSRRAVWVASAMTFDSGVRVSNVTLKRLRGKDHCIRAKAVIVKYQSPTSDTVEAVQGGEALRSVVEEVGGEALFISLVIGCVFSFKSGKVSLPDDKFVVGRETRESAVFLDDLVLWIIRSGVRADDELFTRYPTSNCPKGFGRKVLTAKEFQAGADFAAVACGLPERSVKTSSGRRGCVETARAVGASRDELCHGKWKPGSKVPDKHYLSQTKETERPGTLSRSTSVDTSQAFNVGDVAQIAVSRGLISSSVGVGLPPRWEDSGDVP